MSFLPRSKEERFDTTLSLAAVCVGLLLMLVLCSCSVLTPEQKANLLEYAKSELAAGRITQAQFEALVASFNAKDWSWVEGATTSLVSIAGSLLGVRIWRGGINDRKGEPVTP